MDWILRSSPLRIFAYLHIHIVVNTKQIDIYS